MAIYKLLSPSGVKNTVTDTTIPENPQLLLWRCFVHWRDVLGNTPDPADPPNPPSQDVIDAQDAKQYAKLTALKGMTPAQVQTWVDANVTDLPSAKDAIKTLAIAVSILARQL